MSADTRTDNKRAVQDEINTFLDSLLLETAPTSTIVGVLRYGAHLPHLWSSDRRHAREPVDMVLSHMLEFLPSEFFRGRDFIILDDTVYEGRQMRRHLARLKELGVQEEHVKTAAIICRDVVAQRTNNSFPQHFNRSLGGADYASWKRSLGALVRSQRRSVDRDHPLYFFELRGTTTSELRSILERFGSVSVLSNQSYGQVQAFSVTTDTKVLDGFISNHAGLTLQPFSKLRFYWVVDGDRILLTVVPIVFVTANLESFLEDGGREFERITGIDCRDVEYLRLRDVNAFQRYAFYLTSRATAFELLRLFLAAALPLLKQGGSVISVTAEDQDRPVRYHFPDTYSAFYARNLRIIRSLIEDTPVGIRQSSIEFGWPIDRLQELGGPHMDPKSGMHLRYRILEQLTALSEPIEFDGRSWVAKESPSGLPVSAFLNEIHDPLLVSRCLDELLDAGLLRAEDLPTSPSVFDRVMSPGGESAGSMVSLLAQSVRLGRPVELPAQAHCRGWANDDEF